VHAAVDLEPDALGQERRRRATLSAVWAMNGCPPHPGLTDMQRTRIEVVEQLDHDLGRRRGRDGHAGKAAALLDLLDRVVHVRVASKWPVIESAPACANASTWRSGGRS
jgi:hypothetical protein